ncbi:hypothetical protein [Nocardia sp. NPDC051570]|uniref:hypothetical protein n=1 Tax=Nocardia sp. NPDC051570 TaxID=3364324 RepID=UPI0037A18B6B
MPTVALACLALACSWKAGILLRDNRRPRRLTGNDYRSGVGWIDDRARVSARRWNWVLLAAAAGLVPTPLITPMIGGLVGAACCAAIIAWFTQQDRRSARFTSLCIAMLAASMLVHELSRSFPQVPANSGMLLASFCAGQLYLVAAVRKLRSAQFCSGRVILDNLAYGSVQAAAGNRDFLPLLLLHPDRLAALLCAPSLRIACRSAAVAATIAELLLGLGAVGLVPTAPILVLTVTSHIAFLLMGPVRIVPFSSAAIGMMAMASMHPVLAGIG